MSSYSRNTTIVGILFLIAMISSLAGGGLLESVLNEPGYLINISVNTSKMFIGVILEFINGIAVIGIAVILYPILKQYSESIALGYISFRIVESVFCLVSAAIPLSLIKLSGENINAGTKDVSYFYTLGIFLTEARFNLAEILIPAFFGIGALLFYFLLYKSKLIPRFISVWGFIGALLILTLIFIKTVTIINLIFVLPVILNEIFLGIWLIAKGFNISSIADTVSG